MKIEASINGLDKKIAESQRNEEVYELRKKRTALEHSRLENLPFSERRKEIRSVISDVVEKRIGSIISETATVFYQSFLYAEVLLHYYLMGAPKSKDRLLCIDEGQDISQLQYLLLYRINGDTVCFNIYGDINQKMQQTCGVDQWNSLQKFIKEVPGTVNGKDVSLFHLSENYRNSEEVVSFYMLIALTQQGTRCSNGPDKAQKQLISGASSIEAKAELIHIALQMNASAVVGSQ